MEQDENGLKMDAVNPWWGKCEILAVFQVYSGLMGYFLSLLCFGCFDESRGSSLDEGL